MEMVDLSDDEFDLVEVRKQLFADLEEETSFGVHFGKSEFEERKTESHLQPFSSSELEDHFDDLEEFYLKMKEKDTEKGGGKMKINYSAYFRLFFLILCSAVFIFSFTRLGTSAYEKVFAKEKIYSDNTSIGPVSVKGLSAGEAQAKLETEISSWLQNNKLFLSYGEEKIAVPI